MKKTILSAITVLLLSLSSVSAQDIIELPAVSSDRGDNIMAALRNRQSHRSYSEQELSSQDLSDLVWAAKGVNRENGKLTSPTAQNSQDVDLYVCSKDGVYLYSAQQHELRMVSGQDIRPMLEGRRPTSAPICLLLVADVTRYNGYSEDSPHLKHFYEMGAVDCGIVSQSISLFCSGIGLATVVRAGMDQEGIRAALRLADTQRIWLNHAVGYPGEE